MTLATDMFAARKAFEKAEDAIICEQGGFERVWLHRHEPCGHGGCACPCWTLPRDTPAPQ